MLPLCLTCNKQLSRPEARYCTHHRDRSGKNNGTWKGGKPKCRVCKKPLIHYHNRYCITHMPNTFQRSKQGRAMVSKLMKGNQYRKGLIGNGWKGDDAGYHSKHSWVVKHLGKPTKCEHCNKDNLTGRQIHWANKDHKYLRVEKDWLRLCSKCHMSYDKARGLR